MTETVLWLSFLCLFTLYVFCFDLHGIAGSSFLNRWQKCFPHPYLWVRCQCILCVLHLFLHVFLSSFTIDVFFMHSLQKLLIFSGPSRTLFVRPVLRPSPSQGDDVERLRDKVLSEFRYYSTWRHCLTWEPQAAAVQSFYSVSPSDAGDAGIAWSECVVLR